jgi:4-alpha-glucanotransferase
MNASPTPDRLAGILAPVFALRRDGDLGIGDTACLRDLCDWAADFGVGFLQLLPINETGPDNSPYNAISSVALDPLLLEMAPAAVPGLAAAEVAAERARLGPEVLDGPLVDYPAVRAAKRRLLECAFARFRGDPAGSAWAEFVAFRAAEGGWLDDYCQFRYLMDLEDGRETWDTWAEAFRAPELARGFVAARMAADPEGTGAALAFHAFVQWVAFSQWRALRHHADSRGVKLMGDIPIGVSYYSADVFFEAGQFDLEWSGGAPPERIFKDDPFVQKWGQNWGIPLYRWDAMENDGHRWWRRRIAKLTEIFPLFRIDHTLGFYRIYAFPWRPQRNTEFLPLEPAEAAARCGGRLPGFRDHDDDTDGHRAANRAAGDHRLRMILDAAGDAAVVAEDLGQVPDYVRPHLLELGIPGFKIVHWESGPDGRVTPGPAYPECSFTTICTHDHEAMAGLWRRFLAEARGERGEPDDHWKARRDLRLLGDFAGIHAPDDAWPEYSRAVKWKLLGALLRSRSRYAAFMITDLFGRDERFNVPGVLDQRNWRVRLPWPVAAFTTDPELREECEGLRALAAETSRWSPA